MSSSHVSSGASGPAEIVLEASALRKSFGGQHVLDGVDLRLRRGEVVLLRGPNGSGKTTLLNILTGNLAPDAGTVRLSANGRPRLFAFPRPWWYRFTVDRFAPETVARSGVGRSWQEMRLFETLSLRENIAVAAPGQTGETPASALVRRAAIAAQQREHHAVAQDALAELGLGERGASSADMVSLGQAKRVAIARAVHAGAKLLFLDEPLAGLDPAGVADVMALLERLAREHRVTLVIVEHVFNMPTVLRLAETVWTLGDGSLRVETPAEALADIRAMLGDGMRSWLCRVAGPDGCVEEQMLPGGAKLVHARPQTGRGLGDPLLEGEGLAVRRNRRLVVGDCSGGENGQGVSLSLFRGHVTVLEAPNGWGKTTLLQALAGTLPVLRGTIRLAGQDATGLTAWGRRKLGLSLLQARDQVFPALTVQEALKLSRVASVPPELHGLQHRRASSLSGGEKQKLALACALGGDAAHVVLMDEPFSALDTEAVANTWSDIEGLLAKSGVLIAMPGMQHSTPKNTDTREAGDVS